MQLTTTFLWFVRGSVDVVGLIDLEMPSAAALELLLLLWCLGAELLLLLMLLHWRRLLHLSLPAAAKHVTHELLCEVLRIGHRPGLVENISFGRLHNVFLEFCSVFCIFSALLCDIDLRLQSSNSVPCSR